MAGGLEAAAAGTGAGVNDIIRQAVLRILYEFTARGSIRFLEGGAPKPSEGPNRIRAGHSPYRIKRRHLQTLLRCSKILELRPRDFIDWILDDYCACLLEKGGMMCSWADDLLAYDSPESRARVMKRVRQFRFDTELQRIAKEESSK